MSLHIDIYIYNTQKYITSIYIYICLFTKHIYMFMVNTYIYICWKHLCGEYIHANCFVVRTYGTVYYYANWYAARTARHVLQGPIAIDRQYEYECYQYWYYLSSDIYDHHSTSIYDLYTYIYMYTYMYIYLKGFAPCRRPLN